MSRSTLPAVAPMHAWRAHEPFHRIGWVYEHKEDGWRMLAYKDGGRVRLVSRRAVDHTARFAQLAAAIASLPLRADQLREADVSCARSAPIKTIRQHSTDGAINDKPRMNPTGKLHRG